MTVFIAQDEITRKEIEIDKLKFLESKFPKLKYTIFSFNSNEMIFYSSMVNKKYEFYKPNLGYNSLTISFYCSVNYNGKEIKVYSNPKEIRLIDNEYNNTIKVCQLKNNFKKYGFSSEALNIAYVETAKFISGNPKFKINIEKLEPKLKKLLTFA